MAIIKLLMKALIVGILALGTLLALPRRPFAFRIWEQETVHTKAGLNFGFFRPSRTVQKREVGDLGAYTDQAVIKDSSWIIDSWGFRNSSRCTDPEVVVIGDSFAVGSGLSEQDTLPTQLERLSGRCVRSLALINPAELPQMLPFLNWHPKFVIYEVIERHLEFIPTPESSFSSERIRVLKMLIDPRLSPFVNFINDIFTVLVKLPVREFRISHGLLKTFEQSLFAENKAILGLPSASQNKIMLWTQGESAFTLKPIDFSQSINNLKLYQQTLQSMGSELIFLPIPNKETIYFPRLNEEMRAPLELFLRSKRESVKVISPLEEFLKTPEPYLYHTDDSHWNARGVEITAQLLVCELYGKACGD